ncbi:MAG: HPr(Ser) kinase/phosphatase [Ignavibacteria bacterium]|nr:HPr(Ser) kinase/phosphatase [Ignavibacteria bacterium]
MITIDKKAVSQGQPINVRHFYENVSGRFKIRLLSDESGFDRLIKDQNLHRPGLALAGFVDLFSYARVQIFGNTEMRYLLHLDDEAREAVLHRIFKFDLPCIILTDNNEPVPGMIELANFYHIPVFGSQYSTTKLVYLIGDFLDDQFSVRCSLHGSFVDVYGVGIMFVGKSGIGKSEVALDLVERGHRLVSDDVTILTKKGQGILMGAGTSINKHFLEIRGLGLINVPKMFGVRSIRYQKRLEIIVELEIWDDNSSYDRTGLEGSSVSILDVDIPYVKLPIVPGKNITVISEIISLNYLLKHYGYDAAKDFMARLDRQLKDGQTITRGVTYFEHDFE